MIRQYTETLWDHHRNPRNVGKLPDATGSGEARFPRCGDVTRIYLRVEDGLIADVGWLAGGCGPTIACASAASVLVKGRTVAEAAAVSPHDVARALDGVPEPKMHCAHLAVEALRAALEDDRRRREAAAQPPPRSEPPTEGGDAS